MTLSELLGKLQPHLDDRGDYMVIAGPLSGTDDSVEDKSFHPVVATFADENSKEVILRTSQSPLEEPPDPSGMILCDFMKWLTSHVDQHGAFDVEMSDSGPGDDFRVDFPLAGIGLNDDTRLFAFLW